MVIVSLILIAGGTLAFAAQKPYVTVYKVSGKAEYLPAGETDWISVKLGTELYSGDSVKTQRKAFVEIAFDNRRKNIVRIHPDTHIVISLKGNEKIELIDGEVFLLVQKLPRGSRFEIRTPTAVCGARGTGLGTIANKNKTTASSYEHTSYAKGIKKDGTPGDEKEIPEGFKTEIKKFGFPSKLRKIGGRNYGKWSDWRDNMAERASGRRHIKRERITRNLRQAEKKQAKIEERTDKSRVDRLEKSEDSGGFTQYHYH
jgi:hypothetical protein